jgi:RHS repeat-associated protein
LKYAYAITVPPGRNDLQPDLELQYSNQNTDNDSAFGYGWSTNIPYIQRLNKTGSDNLYSDNNFTSSLSGQLVQVAGTTYAPRVETGDFLKYSFDGSTWTVTDKQGILYTFGSQTSTRQDDPSDFTKIYKWMLEEVRDTNNNYISYSYIKDQGQIYPDVITYTGNGGVPGIFKVAFSYKTRADVNNSYQSQFKVTTAKLVSTISVSISNTTQETYNFSYTAGDNGVRSLIAFVTRTAFDDAGVGTSRTTSFSYTKNSQATVPLDDRGIPTVNWTPSVSGLPPIPTQGCQLAVLNGDTSHGANDCGLRVADLNGDGLPDYIMAYSSMDSYGTATQYYSEHIEVGLNNGNNGFTIVPWELPRNTELYTYWTQPGVGMVLYNTAYPHLVFNSGGVTQTGLQLVDVNGDGRADLVWQDMAIGSLGAWNGLCSNAQQPWKVFINNGSGWDYDPSWSNTPVISRFNCTLDLHRPGEVIFSDVNADGFIDVVLLSDTVAFNPQGPIAQVYLSNRVSGWYASSWRLDYGGFNDYAPAYISDRSTADYTQIADINNDGLPDIIVAARDYRIFGTPYQLNTPPGQWVRIFVNTGAGWVYDASLSTPLLSGNSTAHYPTEQPYRVVWHEANEYNPNFPPSIRSNWVVDINGDGLPDLLANGLQVYLSDGKQWVANSFYTSALQKYVTTPSMYGYLPSSYLFGGSYYEGVIPIDINGDGLVDLNRGSTVIGNPQPQYPWYDKGVFLNQNKVADLLSAITLPTGGSIAVTYKSSAQYKDSLGKLLNPRLPMVIQTVSQITADDGNGNTDTATYSYEDGASYLDPANPTDRKFAGFGAITKTDLSGNKIKSYFHQGDASNSSKGEFADEYWKIGKPYRKESYGSGGHLFSKTINNWGSVDLGNGRKFVKLARTVEFNYDGNETHREKAETYTYDDGTGNLAQKVTWGEVTGNDDGTFTDAGTDAYTTTITYATGSSWNVVGLPSQETTVDQSSNTVKETIYYYDTLSFGLVGKGNLTRREDWKEGSTYIHTTKTYNDYGLVTRETDPRDNPTTYAYDSFNLYPATVNNALNQATQFLYNYAYGKVKQKVDPNGQTFQISYDGLGRVLEEKEPDPSVPSNATSGDPVAGGVKGKPRMSPAVSNLVTKSSYAYTDIGFGSSVKKTDYLDGTLSTSSYGYFDGLGRVIQSRKQAEAANTFSVRDYVYNNLGLLRQESLPYFSTGSAKTAPSSTSTLYTSYTYDALERVVATTTAVGATTNTYDDWKLTVTDANGKAKEFYKDAYDRLVQVDEHNGASAYTTKYEYNGLGKLLKITDANKNVRGFTYDGLGRRLTAEDLHAPGDATFGTWTYDYDDAGNLTSRLDPNGQTCNYKYDDINRVMTEDFAGQAGVEVTYGYDNCSNGVGRLCSVITNSLKQSNTYNPLGMLKTEDKTIDSVNYHTEYGYDRQGNQTKIVNPDSSQVIYKYNSAGLVDQVSEDSQTIVQSVDYSPLGQIALMQYSNGAVTTNTYDPTKLYRLQHKVTLLPNGAASNTVAKGKTSARISILGASIAAQDLTYSYDNVGNVITIVDASSTDTKKTVTYCYDDLYRLTSATTTGAPNGLDYTQNYSYDAVGNIATVTKSDQGIFSYSYQGNAVTSFANPHAVTSITNAVYQTTYQYDKNGNLIANNLGLVNRWDYNNRLSQSVVGESVTTYAYDHNGQRVKYSNGFNTTVYPSRYYNVNRTRTVVRQGAPPADNAVKHIFIGDLLVATVKGSLHTSVYAVHADHLTGSNVISNAAGQIEEVMDYYPFGDIRLDENRGAFTEQRKFAGHEFDYDTGLTYMDARYYNSSSGRFLSVDPSFLAVSADLADPQALNAYAYARNNPVRYIDPDGAAFWDSPVVAVVRGYGVGFAQGVGMGFMGTVNLVIHPVQTAKDMIHTYEGGVRAGADLASSLYRNPRQTFSEIRQGIGITAQQIDEQIQSESPYEQGKTVGRLFGQIDYAIASERVQNEAEGAIKVKHIKGVVDAGGDVGIFGRSGVITKTTATKILRGGLDYVRDEGALGQIKNGTEHVKTGVDIIQSSRPQTNQKKKR